MLTTIEGFETIAVMLYLYQLCLGSLELLTRCSLSPVTSGKPAKVQTMHPMP